jgi:hypothetical protein
MTVENNAAPAPAAPAPKTEADYRNDVTKQLNEKLAPAPAAKPEVKPEIKPEDAPSPTIKLSLQKIAEQNKALREREERVKTFEDIGRFVDPVALSRAAASRNPLAALEAMGMKYEDVVNQVLASQPKAGTQKTEEPKAEPEGIVKELQAKLESLEKERAAEKATKARTEVTKRALTLVSDEKFPLVSRLGEEAIGEAIDVLSDFYEKTGGKYPAETFEANMELALAHVEEKHKKIAERYGLTSGSATRSVKEESEAPVKPRGEANGQTTLTSSSLTAPASGGAAPKTDAEYQAQAAAELRRLFHGG